MDLGIPDIRTVVVVPSNRWIGLTGSTATRVGSRLTGESAVLANVGTQCLEQIGHQRPARSTRSRAPRLGRVSPASRPNIGRSEQVLCAALVVMPAEPYHACAVTELGGEDGTEVAQDKTPIAGN